jgi:hypothetical protein
MNGDISPISLSHEEVKAILSGRKTVMRGLLGLEEINETPGDFKFTMAFKLYPTTHAVFCFDKDGRESIARCRYGTEGDYLWVREHWKNYSDPEQNIGFKDETRERYLASDSARPWSSPPFMPNNACRILLKITGIRPSQLQAVTIADAVKEGVEFKGTGKRLYKNYSPASLQFEFTDPRDSFQSLWKSIYGTESWDRNEWAHILNIERVNPKEEAIASKTLARWLKKAGI